MIFKYDFETKEKMEMINIDSYIYDALKNSDLANGSLIVFSPHTTSAITINENGDPDVLRDLILGFNILSPDRKEFLHFEGNSSSHLLSSLIGVSQELIIRQQKPILGKWQSLYFCEFDGPRNRTIYIKLKED